MLFAACTSSSPTPTGTTCADPDPVTGTTTLTYDNFGQQFMETYCTNCHSSDLTHAQRNGAPIYHDFDTLEGVLEVPDHIDEQTGIGPKASNHFMPGDGTNGRCPSMKGGSLDEACPEPTDEERTQLAQWIACEVQRPHTF
ncbi:MAG TPA: hypothetical protein VGC41_08315 [Kofleriaceae bacterium]